MQSNKFRVNGQTVAVDSWDYHPAASREIPQLFAQMSNPSTIPLMPAYIQSRWRANA